MNLSFYCTNATIHVEPHAGRCCFSESPVGPCQIIEDAAVSGTCAYPKHHPRTWWYVRVLESAGGPVRMDGNGRITYWSPSLSQSSHSLFRCSEHLSSQPMSDQVRVDTAICAAFAAGALMSLLSVLFVIKFRAVAVRRYLKMPDAVP